MVLPVDANAFLEGANLIGLHGDKISPQVNLSQPGVHGYIFDPAYINSAIPYISNNAVIHMIHAPGWMDYVPEGAALKKHLRSLAETHAQVWDGFIQTLTPEYDGPVIDGNGNKLEVMTSLKRTPVSPSLQLPDRAGRPIQLFIEHWLQMVGPHPDSQVHGIVSRKDIRGTLPPIIMNPSFTGMTLLVYEPSPCRRYIDKAVVVTNMMPKGAGDNTLKRDRTASGTMLDLSIEWTGIGSYGAGVIQMALEHMQRTSVVGTYPDLRSSIFTTTSEDQISGNGSYEATIQKAADQQI